jgi:hypothetical protein
VGLEQALHLGDRDVLAGADDDVFDAADDREPALVVDRRQISGAKPTPAGVRGARLQLFVGTADEELRPAQPQLPTLPDTQLDVARWSTVRIARPVEGIAGVARRDGWCLGRSVGALDDGAERLSSLVDERRRDPGAAGRDEAQTGHPFGGETGRRHQCHEERRRPDHERDPLIVDDAEGLLGIPLLHERRAHAGDAREQDAVEEAGDVGEGSGHEHGVLARELMHVAHELALVEQAPLGVKHSLGGARRS